MAVFFVRMMKIPTQKGTWANAQSCPSNEKREREKRGMNL